MFLLISLMYEMLGEAAIDCEGNQQNHCFCLEKLTALCPMRCAEPSLCFRLILNQLLIVGVLFTRLMIRHKHKASILSVTELQVGFDATATYLRRSMIR